MRINIGVKVTLLISLVAAFIAVSLILITITTITPKLQEDITNRLSDSAFHTVDKIDRFLFERLSDIEALTSEHNFMLVGDRHNLEEKLAYLIDFQDKKRVYASISLYNSNGTKLLDTRGLRVGANEKNKPFFKEAIKGNYYSDPSPVLSESVGSPVVHFSGPLKDENGDIIGVVVTRFPINKINDIVQSLFSREVLRLPSEVAIDVDLVDSEGLLLFSDHDPEDILQRNLGHLEIFAKIKRSDKRLETTIAQEELQRGNEHAESLFIGVEQSGFLGYEGDEWVLIASIDRADAFSPIKNLTRRFSLIGAFMSIAVIFLSFFLSRRISVPIKTLRDSALEIAKGNLDYKSNIKTGDEIGELSQAFEKMTVELKGSKKKIEMHSFDLQKQIKRRTQELQEKIKEAEVSKKATFNILEDIDESNKQLMEAQEKLTEYVAELEQLDSQKDQFISIAAHELKTPLTSIKGFSSLLVQKKISENPAMRDKYLNIIVKDVNRLAELITNILELSRMDLGTLKIEWQRVAISELITEVKEQMDVIIKGKGLGSTYTIEDNLPPISIDKNRMVQVISNLVNNAVHYTDKGSIAVGARKKDGNVLFSVTDTGAGISKKQFEKIFERFYQVDNPLTRKIGGTGLGLSLCRGFVEAMGGKIWVESEVGKGSTFYFTVPLKKRLKKKKEINLFKELEEKGYKPVDKRTKKKIIEQYRLKHEDHGTIVNSSAAKGVEKKSAEGGKVQKEVARLKKEPLRPEKKKKEVSMGVNKENTPKKVEGGKASAVGNKDDTAVHLTKIDIDELRRGGLIVPLRKKVTPLFDTSEEGRDIKKPTTKKDFFGISKK